MNRKNVIQAGLLVLAVTLVANAGEEKTRSFVGEIGDSQCAFNVHSLTRSHTEMMKNKSMGGTPTNCTNYCIKYLGGDFVLAVGDVVYRLDDQEKASAFAGLKVKLTGSLDPKDKSKTIHVTDIHAAE